MEALHSLDVRATRGQASRRWILRKLEAEFADSMLVGTVNLSLNGSTIGTGKTDVAAKQNRCFAGR